MLDFLFGLFDKVLAIIADLGNTCMQFIIDICHVLGDWVFELIKITITFCFDKIMWFNSEMTILVKNILVDLVSSFALEYGFNIDHYLIESMYVNVNGFFPLDTLITVCILLIGHWVYVRASLFVSRVVCFILTAGQA